MDNEIEQIKSLLQTNINNDVLIHILFDINKYFDQVLTKVFRQEQKKENKIFNSIERKLLRNYYYYGNLDETILNIAKDFPTIKYSDEDICKVLSASLDRIKKYEKEKILNSIEQKNLNLNKYNKSSISHRKEWLEYYDKKREQIFDYSMFILRITNSDFQEHNSNEQYIYDIIKNTYIKLENYRYLALVFDNSIKDKNGDDITWKLIYKICIYAENFVQYDKDYFACKKKKRIDELNSFIQEKFNVSDINIASDFYKNISTGYKFEDCLISDNQEDNISLYQSLRENNITIDNLSYIKLQVVNQFINDNLILFLALFFALCVFSVLMIFNFIVVTIKNSTKDIGIYMSLGMNGLRISFIYLFQILVVSTISFIISLIGAIIFLNLLDTNLSAEASNLINQYYNLNILPIDFQTFKVTSTGITISLLIAYIVPTLSVIIPLINLSRKRPIDVLKVS